MLISVIAMIIPMEMSNSSPGIKNLKQLGLMVSDQVSAMLAYWDKNQVCRFATNAYMDWFGKTKAEMINKISMKELLGHSYLKNVSYIKGALAGQKQIFESETLSHNGKSRFSLVTFVPDLDKNEVTGFHVHVADVTHIKELEEELVKSRRDLLRSVINIQETERATIANVIRESVTQTLASCNMMLKMQPIAENKNEQSTDLTQYIQQAIEELKSLCYNLIPTGFDMLGFKLSIEEQIEFFSVRHNFSINISYTDDNDNIEKLAINDKLSAYRIVQSFLNMMADSKNCSKIDIYISSDEAQLELDLCHNDKEFIMEKNSRHYKDIALRTEYYGGKIYELQVNDLKILQIKLIIE